MPVVQTAAPDGSINSKGGKSTWDAFQTMAQEETGKRNARPQFGREPRCREADIPPDGPADKFCNTDAAMCFADNSLIIVLP